MKLKKIHLLNNKNLVMSLSTMACLSLLVVSDQAQEGMRCLCLGAISIFVAKIFKNKP